LDDEQGDRREQQHTSESPQEHDRRDRRQREQRATAAATITSGTPSLKPPLASSSHRNCNGTLKLSPYATAAMSSHARKLEMIASPPPMSPSGDGSSARGLAMPRAASQTPAATARRDRGGSSNCPPSAARGQLGTGEAAGKILSESGAPAPVVNLA
jgi:hypothetical protein